MARVLGRVRISRLTDESTSISRQRELIEDWAKANGHEIVAWAEDVEVSGSISPFDAPELGKFLTVDGARGWDILVAWKLDRLARNAINLNKLFGWVQENNKELVCISDNIDLSTWVGRMIAGVIAGLAEGELEAITERVVASKRAIRKAGRFQGGPAPFGYRTVERDGGGKELAKDPAEQKTLQWIFQQALANRPVAHIVNDLNGNTDGINESKRGGRKWYDTTVIKLLENKVYLGWTMHNGQPVLGDDGEPVRRCEPSISIEDFNRIQQLRDQRGYRVRSAPETSPLLGVIECWECGKNMHINRHNKRGVTSTAYFCRYHEKHLTVNAKVAEETFAELFLDTVADLPILEKQISVIQSSAEQLAEARATYKDIADYLPSAPDEAMRKELFRQLDIVGRKIQELEKSVHTSDGVSWVDTGVTYGQRWAELDTDGRRELVTAAGIRYRVRQIKPGNRWYPPIQETELILPEQLRLLANTKAVDVTEALTAQQDEFLGGLSEEHRQQIEDAK